MVRHKNRYMVIEIHPQGQMKEKDVRLGQFALQTAIFKKVQQLHGDFGMAAITTGFLAKYCNEKTRIAIVRTRHGPHKLVNSSLPFINTIGGKRVALDTLYVGATIRRCFKFILHFQQRKVDEICATVKTDAEKKAIKEALLNFDSFSRIT